MGPFSAAVRLALVRSFPDSLSPLNIAPIDRPIPAPLAPRIASFATHSFSTPVRSASISFPFPVPPPVSSLATITTPLQISLTSVKLSFVTCSSSFLVLISSSLQLSSWWDRSSAGGVHTLSGGTTLGHSNICFH